MESCIFYTHRGGMIFGLLLKVYMACEDYCMLLLVWFTTYICVVIGLSINKKNGFKSLIVHLCIIVVYIGFIIIGLESINISLPDFVMKIINTIGGCTTVINMLIIIAIFFNVQWNELIEKFRLFFYHKAVGYFYDSLLCT